MHILEQLGVALGLASLAGVNLYLTVFITGLAIRFDWVHLADKYQHLDVLGHPAVLAIAGVLYALEFFADKVPWLDSLWDSVHTIIRPVGGTLLAVQALGDMPAYVQVSAALLAGGAALTTHGAKAGTRLLINHSPEPVTNIAMSLGEDVAVTGGVALVIMRPIVALVVFGVIIALIWMIFPRLWRIIRTTVWLAWHKLRMPGRRYPLANPEELGRELSDELRDLLKIQAGLDDTDVKWTVPCLTGKSKGLRGLSPNLRGLLIGTENATSIVFVANRILRDRLFQLPLAGAVVEVESKFLSENLVLEASGIKAVFRFPRGQGDLVETMALRVRELIKCHPGTMAFSPEVLDEPAAEEARSPQAKNEAHEGILPLPAIG
jgi:Domain of unknown function (DUF4126)